MADTLPNIVLPPRVWVDLYSESGIEVGMQILTQNIGVCAVSLTTQLAQPTGEDAHQIIERGSHAVNDAGSVGEWAFCFSGGLVNVRLTF